VPIFRLAGSRQPTLRELYNLLPEPSSYSEEGSHHGVLWISEWDYISKQCVPHAAHGHSVLVSFQRRRDEGTLCFHVGSTEDSYKEGIEFLMALGGYKRVSLQSMEGKVDFPVDWWKLERLIDMTPSIEIVLVSMIVPSVYMQLLAKAKHLGVRHCKLENDGEELTDSILLQRKSMSLDIAGSFGDAQLSRLLQSIANMKDGAKCVQNLNIAGKNIGDLVAERLGCIPLESLSLNIGVDFPWRYLRRSKLNQNGPRSIVARVKSFYSGNQWRADAVQCAQIGQLIENHPSLHILTLDLVCVSEGLESLVGAIRKNACLRRVYLECSSNEDVIAMLGAVSSHARITKARIRHNGGSTDKERLQVLMSQAESVLEQSSMLFSLKHDLVGVKITKMYPFASCFCEIGCVKWHLSCIATKALLHSCWR